MKKTAIINGKIINGKGKLETLNILVEKNKIIGLGYLPDDDPEKSKGYEVIDLKGKLIFPNLTDSFVAYSEPGFEFRESLDKLGEAALNGGITSIIGAPKTKITSPETYAYFKHKSESALKIPGYAIGGLTQNDTEMVEFKLMKEMGACAFTDWTSPDNSTVLKTILQYTDHLNCPIVVRPFDSELSKDSVMNSGYRANVLGLKGQPPVAEVLRIQRDIELVNAFGGHIHFFPITTKESVDAIRQAKKRGIKITCGTAPQYLYFTEDDVEGYDTNMKVWPPLRKESDIKALIEGIKDGTIDTIASDHKPLSLDEKRADFNDAHAGVAGIETLFLASYNKLHLEEKISLKTVLDLMSVNVKNIYHIDLPSFSIGNKMPNITVLDTEKTTHINSDFFKSTAKNSPFIGHEFKGKIDRTLIF